MLKNVDGVMLRKMILAGASLLDDNRKYVDSLNVFPVPDGDTGTNMSMTMKSVVNEINNCQVNDISTLSMCISNGALRGARGNSGVILSQILKGLCIVFAEEKNITTKTFAKAINKGAQVAYQAVTKPKEGTILTVISAMAEASLKISKKTQDIGEFITQVNEAGDAALKSTPDLLPVLKKAGVVDSGGQGLMIIFAGFQKIANNDESLVIKMETVEPTTDSVIPNYNPEVFYDNLADIVYGYCTEFIIIEMKKKTTMADIEMLKNRLMEIGDSVLCIGDLSLVKIHVHTNEPNKALAMGLELGELSNLKIENMREENRELRRKNKNKEPLKEFGIVSVCAGKGLSQIFKEAGVDYCIEGGQTMNPSSEDIAKAINQVNAKHVFVLPNNKNIIMAAQQSKDLTDKAVHVINSTNIPEGISACLQFNPEATLEENIDNMTQALKQVKSASVTYAVRKTHISGFDLELGDKIGLSDKDVIAKGKDVDSTVESMLETLINDDTCSVMLYYGNEVKQEEAEALRDKLREKYEMVDIDVVFGGQPVYYYLMSIE